MIDRSTVSTALLVVGAVLLVGPALAPVEPVLLHEHFGDTVANESELEADGVTVLTYANLSERGKELYERTLRSDGSYQVPAGEGAPEFEYEVEPESGTTERQRRQFGRGVVAIERPEDVALPDDDPRPDDVERREGDTGEGARSGSDSDTASDGTASQTERRSTQQYDLLRTRTGQPPLTDPGNLIRFLAVLAGVVTVGSGGYLRSKP